ncbi:hypothetical protein GCM10022226_18310 [Sphaerisporangium flaviroseum]|uniref:Htaa domain protein n=2 Tax=Sphaerisporangium flaviroseum TaxID=509199 RepID=A0ABP7HM70_9ACTN
MAMGAGALTLVTSPASAGAALAAPDVSSVEVSPSPVVVENKDGKSVTFSFVVDGATSGGFTLRRPNGSHTSFDAKKVEDLSGGKQKWQGTRTFGRSDAPGDWKVTAKATSVVGTGTASKNFQVKQVWETDLAGFGASPEPIDQGDTLTLRGRLLINSTDGWRSYKGQKVYIAFRAEGSSGYKRVDYDYTDWKGRFSAGVKAEGDGWWRAEYDGSSVAHKSVSDSDQVDVLRKSTSSRIVGFDVAPDPADQGDELTARGRLQIDTSHGWDGIRGRKVNLLFKPDGSRSWQFVAYDWTGRGGWFSIDAQAEKSGWYRAEFRGSKGVKGTSSRAVYVTVKQPPAPADTRIIKFNAYPEPVKYGKYVKNKGKLQIWDGDHWTSYDHKKVALYFKRAGHSNWEYVKTVRTNGSGNFWTQVKAWHSGYWKIRFKGNDEAESSASRSDYVKVKK